MAMVGPVVPAIIVFSFYYFTVHGNGNGVDSTEKSNPTCQGGPNDENLETQEAILSKDLYQVQETLKTLCEFSIIWADRAGLGSQKSFSKMTSILPRKTHDNFQI